MLKIVNGSRKELLAYLERQLNNFFPDGQSDILNIIDCHLDEALNRLNKCINAVKMWREGEFDWLHSSQYTIFLYYLSNTIWKKEQQKQICTKLFFLNKALNGIDCFYEIEMPDVFFIGHSVGIVLAKATYGNHLVLYQNSTVGKNHGVAPVIGNGVIMYPNTAIIGRCNIGAGTVISQGTSIINSNTPGNCIAFSGDDGGLIFKLSGHPIIDDFFRF